MGLEELKNNNNNNKTDTLNENDNTEQTGYTGKKIIDKQRHCMCWLICLCNGCVNQITMAGVGLKFLVGGVVGSILVAVQFFSNLWRDSCQLWDIFYIFGSNSEQSMQYLRKKYNGKSSRTLWSMNHRVMVVKSLDNSFYMLLDPTPWQAKRILRVFLLLVSLYIDMCVFIAIHPLVDLCGFQMDQDHQQLIWNRVLR